jgi:hypothetical protein
MWLKSTNLNPWLSQSKLSRRENSYGVLQSKKIFKFINFPHWPASLLECPFGPHKIVIPKFWTYDSDEDT